jgi:hypothetical protein
MNISYLNTTNNSINSIFIYLFDTSTAQGPSTKSERMKERINTYKIKVKAVGIRRANHATSFYPQIVATNFTGKGGLLVRIVSSRTKAMEL